MKKNVMKTMAATVCVVAAGMGGMKAYNVSNLSEADMLFAENVEALSQGDDAGTVCNTYCTYSSGNRCTFQYNNQYWACLDMTKK
jgi:hypothetical protein